MSVTGERDVVRPISELKINTNQKGDVIFLGETRRYIPYVSTVVTIVFRHKYGFSFFNFGAQSVRGSP